jgi:hypothetical protein
LYNVHNITEDEAANMDVNGRATYLRVCEELGIVPASYFTRHMDCTEVSMKYHGLGPSGAKAIAAVLKVCSILGTCYTTWEYYLFYRGTLLWRG